METAVKAVAIKWKMGELMKRYRVTNRDLAEVMDRHETAISRLKTPKVMPRVSGEEIDEIRSAISKVMESRGIEVRVAYSDLLELSED